LALASTQPFNRNEYQGYFLEGKGSRCEGLTTSPFSCADSLEIWKPLLSRILRACNRPVQGLHLLCVIAYIFLSFTHLHSFTPGTDLSVVCLDPPVITSHFQNLHISYARNESKYTYTYCTV
jgi:hypothetical protein